MAIEISGGSKVCGELSIQGSKNAVLPIMAAALLGDGRTVIENCPDIRDVHVMAQIMRSIGAVVDYEDHVLTVEASSVDQTFVSDSCAGDIRASVLFLGSLLSKYGAGGIRYPGGCSIGSRPIDFHLQAFQKMGITVEEKEEEIFCGVEDCVRGASITLTFPSVGATENILLAAVMARGETIISGAAREPEIVHLCHFLNAMGAKIQGMGTDTILIEGVRELRGVTWQLCPDRIVFLTWALLTAGCGGEASLWMKDEIPVAEREVLTKLGCQIYEQPGRYVLVQKGMQKPIRYLRTRPFPGYPTDGQSLLMPVLCKGMGISTIEEGIFENRFRMIRQLKKMGADIAYVSNRARITGVTRLHGASVTADDLRSGAGLLIAASMAEGVSEIGSEIYIERGYERVIEQMRALGIQARYS